MAQTESEVQRLERVLRGLHAADHFLLSHDPLDMAVFERVREAVEAAAKSGSPVVWPNLAVEADRQ